MPFIVIVSLAAVLAAAALLFDGDGGERAAAPLRADPVERIAERVERERALTFVRTPKPLQVSGEQARREGVAALDQDYPRARRRADADLLILLGLLPPGTDLGEAVASTYGSGVAGYYDPRSGRMRIVEGAQTANRVLYEITVAHELNHALEDQRFDFDLERLAAGDDAALAYSALIEGSATALMNRYLEHRFGAEEAFGGLAASAFQPTGDLPPFLMAQLVFPYIEGETFVNRLLELGRGDWTVVNSALRVRPPTSSEQIMHPQAYLEGDEPARVAPVRAPGWRELRSVTLGEWLTGKLLARAGGTAYVEAAAGWGGDRAVLFGRGDRRALIARWKWDTRADAGEFTDALRAWGEEGLPDDSPVVARIRRRGDTVTLVLAPRGIAFKAAAGR